MSENTANEAITTSPAAEGATTPAAAWHPRKLFAWAAGAVVFVAVVIGIALALSQSTVDPVADTAALAAAGTTSVASTSTTKAEATSSAVSSTATVQAPSASASDADQVATAPGATGSASSPTPRPTRPPAKDWGTVASLSGFTIVVDAGHQRYGDSTPEPIGPGATETKARVTTGTTGVNSRALESAVNLDIALMLRDKLQALGARVVMVRTSQNVNISNAERSAIANNAGADLFIRLHCNGSTNPSDAGIMTLVPGDNQWTGPIVGPSRSAAAVMHPMLLGATGARNEGIIPRNDLSGFNYSTVPSVLFEMGYLTNPEEDRLLNSQDYRQAIVNAIAAGASAYLN